MTDQQAEVVVIGGGTMGSMITWRLSAQGHKVICIEADNVAHSRSAVAGDSRLFRRSYRGEIELDGILSIAEQQWKDLNSAAGEDIFVNCGGLYIGNSDGDYLTELVECCRRNHLEYEILSAAETRRRFPQHRVGDHESALFEPSAGFLRTERAVHAAFRLAENEGATVLSNAPVRSVQESNDQVVVGHDRGTITADSVVIAAGTGSPTLLPALCDHLEPRREILTWFPVLEPQDFDHSKFPIFVHIDGEFSAYGAPSLDGSTLKSTLDGRAKPISEYPDHRYVLTSDEISESEATAAKFFNDILPKVSRQECLSDLYTSDRQAIVGRVPGKVRTFVATGFSGTGFKMSAGVGEMFARSYSDGTDLPNFWNPARFA